MVDVMGKVRYENTPHGVNIYVGRSIEEERGRRWASGKGWYEFLDLPGRCIPELGGDPTFESVRELHSRLWREAPTPEAARALGYTEVDLEQITHYVAPCGDRFDLSPCMKCGCVPVIDTRSCGYRCGMATRCWVSKVIDPYSCKNTGCEHHPCNS